MIYRYYLGVWQGTVCVTKKGKKMRNKNTKYLFLTIHAQTLHFSNRIFWVNVWKESIVVFTRDFLNIWSRSGWCRCRCKCFLHTIILNISDACGQVFGKNWAWWRHCAKLMTFYLLSLLQFALIRKLLDVYLIQISLVYPLFVALNRELIGFAYDPDTALCQEA